MMRQAISSSHTILPAVGGRLHADDGPAEPIVTASTLHSLDPWLKPQFRVLTNWAHCLSWARSASLSNAPGTVHGFHRHLVRRHRSSAPSKVVVRPQILDSLDK
jgi:hypothetical protein